MGHHARLALALALAAVLLSVAPTRAREAGMPCLGRYLVTDGSAPLIKASQPAAIDAVMVTRAGIGISSGCAFGRPDVRPTRTGWVIRARWRACGASRRVRLRATVSRDCTALRGRVQAAGRPPTRFSAASSRCGDGIVDADAGERCEPPGTATCNEHCRRLYPVPPRCGDGHLDPGEDCDDGNLTNGDGCDDCRRPRCGDGRVDPGEECDDGNDDDTDGCTTACTRTCAGQAFDSTWQAIQELIVARHGCAVAACHTGPQPQGGLDLTPPGTYARLINVPSTADPGMKRVVPGDEDASLFWRKLRAGTSGVDDVPGSPMPLGTAPLSADEVTAIRLWIRGGAAETGTVPGTADLLDACLGPPTPPKIVPPGPPPLDLGVQLYAPPWDVPPQGEDEVCFATYYDVTPQLQEHRPDALIPCPPDWGGAGNQCFSYGGSELTQDPNSHHSIIRAYRGAYPATDPGFAPYTCHGGPKHGQSCNPLGLGVAAPDGADCGARSGCAGRIVSTVACNLYGPPDFGFTLGTDSGNLTSPGIGGSQAPHTVQRFPAGAYAVLPTRGVLVWNSHAFNVTDQPTTNEQWFHLFFAGPEDRHFPVVPLFDATDIFVQNVPPFETREYCNTHLFPKGTRLFELSSHFHKRGKLFRIWDPAGTLVLTTTEYSDPSVARFDPPVPLDGDDPASRTYRFCALYDNGATDPAEVKRRSTSPLPPIPLSYLGGPCDTTEVACMAGPRQGQLCYGNDRTCDSTPTARDGICDACPLKGGVTTDDEMFILIGAYYVLP